MRNFFNNEHSVSITPASIMFAVFFILGLYFLYYIREIVVLFFLALILMSALNPGVKFLEKRLRLPRILGIFILYVVIILLMILSIVVIVPPLASQIPTLIHALALPPLPDHLQTLHFNLNSLNEISNFVSQIGASVGAVYSVVMSAFSSVFGFITVLVLACYLLLDRDHLHQKISWFSTQKRHADLTKELIDNIEINLGGWVRGQLLLMLSIGVLTYIGLSVLSIPFALPLSLAAGLLEILPNLGPLIAALPGIAVSYSTYGPAMAGFTALFYLIIQQLENNFVVPRIMEQNVDVNPLTTILVILIGLKVAGIMGAFLAVPLYIVLRSTYSLWLREYGGYR